jgi:chitodextrinase
MRQEREVPKMSQLVEEIKSTSFSEVLILAAVGLVCVALILAVATLLPSKLADGIQLPIVGPRTPTITLDQKEVYAGDNITVDGKGWPSESTVNFYLAAPGEDQNLGHLAHQVTTDRNGSFFTHLPIPADLGWEELGQATVTARVEGSKGEAQQFMDMIGPRPPDPIHGVVGELLHFDASGSTDSDGTVKNYFWGFGDGTWDLGSNVTHAYRAPGRYTVTCTVTDNGWLRDTATYDVEIDPYPFEPNQPPTAIISGANSEPPDEGQTCDDGTGKSVSATGTGIGQK